LDKLNVSAIIRNLSYRICLNQVRSIITHICYELLASLFIPNLLKAMYAQTEINY